MHVDFTETKPKCKEQKFIYFQEEIMISDTKVVYAQYMYM